MSLPLLLFASIVTSNIALTYFLGMCPFITISKNLDVAIGMGAAVTFVMTVTAAANWVLNYLVLVPLGLPFLQFLVFIVTIAFLVQIIEIFLDRFSPALYQAFGIFLPLITVNCAVFGAVLFMIIRQYSFLASLAYGIGGGLGWALAIVAMAGLRAKMARARVPRGLEGAGIALIIAGIMSLAFMGFSGMIPAN